MNTPEQVIAQFLSIEGLWPDEKLAALQAHNDDERLSFVCCCCLIGTQNASHALKSEDEVVSFREWGHVYAARWIPGAVQSEDEVVSFREWGHVYAARWIPGAAQAEMAFRDLGHSAKYHWQRDAERRKRLKPIITAEWERRAEMRRTAAEVCEEVEAMRR